MPTQSEQWFKRAEKSIPGGVNSPVHAFRGVGGTPLFIKSAKGAYVTDVDDKTYIDYVASWGPMIAGQTHPKIIAAVKAAIENGLSFGAPNTPGCELAEKIRSLVPSMEQLRMVNSGTEATMSAIRLARGFTGRDKIIKFSGCYHGHADSLLVASGSGTLTLGIPDSAGVPASIAQHTLVAEYNDLAQVEKLLEKYGDDTAAIIVEPVAGNMNCVLPQAGFLAGLRKLCDQYGCVLIFDEVITGFRVALGGAQARYGVTPDLTTLGKIIGGGMPVGAFGGRADIMQCIAPLGPVYQAGTLSGNPIAMAAGLASLDLVSQPGFYEQLEAKTHSLVAGLKDQAAAANIPVFITNVGGMFGLFFTNAKKITCYFDVKQCDVKRYQQFFHGMLAEGIYLAPSAFESGFMSQAHSEADIQKTIAAVQKVFSTLNNHVPA